MYCGAGFAASFICAMALVFVRVAQSALHRADAPFARARQCVRSRLTLFIWCGIGFPVYMAGFSAVKAGISPITGFRFDSTLANIDAALFGRDAWRVAHAVVGPFAPVMEFIYFPAWTALLAYSIGLAAAFANRKRAATFINAIAGTWFIGGVILAYSLSSAGPILAEMVSPELAARFLPLHHALAAEVASGSYFLRAPAYLQTVANSGGTAVDYGISAMPSMHLAQALLYVFLTKSTKLFWPAVAFASLIYLGSIFSGFHYATDGIVAAVVVIACWTLSEAWVRWSASDRVDQSVAVPVC
jgi:hypothetical protein